MSGISRNNREQVEAKNKIIGIWNPFD